MAYLKPVFTSEAPKPVGPYSQAMRFGSWLVCSGQIPLDPKTSEVVGTEIIAQSEQVFANLRAVLVKEGMTFKDVVKSLVFLTDLKSFSEFNKVYEKHFLGHKPARSCVEVSALPKSVFVEVEVWAYRES